MLEQNQMIEAIDRFYADDVEIIEADGETARGKEAQKARCLEWLQSIDTYHGGGVHAITSNEEAGVTMVESWSKMTFKGAPAPMNQDEVAVQHWKDGKIVRERFYYNAADA